MYYPSYSIGSLSDHIYLPLKKVEKEIRSEFDNLLRRSSEKLEEIALKEKNLWLRLDETQQDCNRMIAEVDKKAEEQVFSIFCGDMVPLFPTILIASKYTNICRNGLVLYTKGGTPKKIDYYRRHRIQSHA